MTDSKPARLLMSAFLDGPSLLSSLSDSLAAELEQPSAWKRRVQRRKEKAGVKEPEKDQAAEGPKEESKATASEAPPVEPPQAKSSDAPAVAAAASTATVLPKPAVQKDDDAASEKTELEDDKEEGPTVAPLRRALDALRARRVDLDKAYADLDAANAENEASQEQLQEVQAELESERDTRASLEDATDSLRKQLGIQVANSESTRKAQAALREELAEEKRKNSSSSGAQAELEELRSELAEAREKAAKVEKLAAGATQLREHLAEVVKGNKFYQDKYSQMKTAMEVSANQLKTMQAERDDLKQQLASGGVTQSQLAELEKELKNCSVAQKELEELRASHRDYTGAANIKFDELRRLKSGLLNTKADFENGGETWSAAEAFRHIEAVVDRVETWASTAVQPPTISSGKRPANSQVAEAPSNMEAADGDGLAKEKPKEKKHKRRRKEKEPKQASDAATVPPEPTQRSVEPAPAPAPARNRDTDATEPVRRHRDVADPPKEATADVEKVARPEQKEHKVRREKVPKEQRDPDRERRRRRDAA